MITRKMLKEEWRMHSELFSGRSFAAFPFMIFLISLFGFWSIDNFSTLGSGAISSILLALGIFMGLAVGSIGFSSRDAIKNVLGPTNFLVYSSRTLPADRKKLMTAFIVKDIIYYLALFLIPLAGGALVAGGPSILKGSFGMLGGFVVSLALSVLLAKASMQIPRPGMVYNSGFSPLVSKSILDISRSAGGFLKILFSLALLTGFYWFMVLYFPFTGSLLTNPVLSFSVLIGTVSLTVYNWINRFDGIGDYRYLPLKRKNLLSAKQRGFLLISVPLNTLFLLISFLIYPTVPLQAAIALTTSLSAQLFTLGLASYLTGLEPNSRLFDTIVFTKFLLINSLFIIPLLGFSVFLTPGFRPHFLVAACLPGVFGFLLCGKSLSKID